MEKTAAEHIHLAEQAVVASFHHRDEVKGNQQAHNQQTYLLLANYHATMAVYARIDAMLRMYGQ